MNASPDGLAASMGNLNVNPRKKRPTRAFHDVNAMNTAPVGVPQNYPDQSQFQAAQPQMQGYQQVSANVVPGLAHNPMQGMGPGAVDYANIPPTTVNVTNPVQMAREQQPEISLAAARKQLQLEYCTPHLVDGVSTYKWFRSMENVLPPMAGTQFFALDQATAVPKFIRSTLYYAPESDNLRRASKLPVAVTVRPFAPLLASEEPVPVVDMSTLGATESLDPLDAGPPRCNRCRTFMNPSMEFRDDIRFTCNICRFPNNRVPQEYACGRDAHNFRLDRQLRPELHKGVYDIILPDYYHVGGKPSGNKGFHHVFLIDICHQSIRKLLPVLVADALRAAIFDYQNEGGVNPEEKGKFKFAIMLFDSKIHYFNLSSKLQSAQLVTSPDLTDPFVPFVDGLFADPEDCASQINDALNKIEALQDEKRTNDPETCLSVALRSAMMCLEQVGGGKITAVLSTLSKFGPGSSEIKSRRTVGTSLADQEKEYLSPHNKYYQLLGKDMVALNVALDLFVIDDAATDIANIGWLASITGGYVHKWVNFISMRDGRSFSSKMYNSVHKTVGYQGLFKLRCSTGLQVLQYYGFPASGDSGIVGYSNPGLPDPTIPVLNEDQTFTVLLEYDGVLKTNLDCHYQASILYTDAQGVRKLRVINLVTAVTERLADVFAFVDQEACVTAILRDTLSFMGKQLIVDLRKSINEKLVDVLAHYKALSEQQHTSNFGPPAQLVFPDSLKHFMLFLLAVTKTRALRDMALVSDDLRLCDVYEMMYMPLERLSYHLCPALVELHSLSPDDCMVLEDEANTDFFIQVPEYKALTASATAEGVYVLCNGTTVYVRIHPQTSIYLLKDLFGDHINDYKDIDGSLDCFPDLPTLISQQARNLVKFFHKNIIGSSLIDDMSIVIARDQIDPAFHLYKACLIEDTLPSTTVNTSPSYNEFMKSVHSAVNVQLKSDQKTKKDLETTRVPETLAQKWMQF